MSDWMPTCKEIGGPVNVDFEFCLQQDFGCDAFKKGHCDFGEENILQNIAGHFHPELCQVMLHILQINHQKSHIVII